MVNRSVYVTLILALVIVGSSAKAEEETAMAHMELIRVKPMKVLAFNCFDEDGEPEKGGIFKEWLIEKGIISKEDFDSGNFIPMYGFNNPSPGRRPKGYGYDFWLPIDDNMVADLKDLDKEELPPNCSLTLKNFPGNTYFATRHSPQPVSLMRGYEEKIVDEVFEIPEDMKLSVVAWDVFLNPEFNEVEKEAMKWLESHGFAAYHGRWIERSNNTHDGKIDVYLPILEKGAAKSLFGMDFRFWLKESSKKTMAEEFIWQDRDADKAISEPMVETQDAFTVAGLMVHHMDKSEDIIHVWERFRSKWQDKLESMSVDDDLVGLAIPSEDPGSWYYLAGMRVKAGAAVPEGVTVYDVPAGTYAKAKTTVEEMEYTYFTIYRNWLHDSPYEKDMELPAIDMLSQDKNNVTICIPVKHRD